MVSNGNWLALSLAAIVLVQPARSALADEAGCLVVGAWDEARGEPLPVIEAVVSTIVNRARARGVSICDAVIDPYALTGVTPAMHELFAEAARPHGTLTAQPHTAHDHDQLAAVEAAAAGAVAGTLADPTNGATHFYSPSGMRELGLPPAPKWASAMVHTATIGPFVFLREKNRAPLSPSTSSPAAAQLAVSEEPEIELFVAETIAAPAFTPMKLIPALNAQEDFAAIPEERPVEIAQGEFEVDIATFEAKPIGFAPLAALAMSRARVPPLTIASGALEPEAINLEEERQALDRGERTPAETEVADEAPESPAEEATPKNWRANPAPAPLPPRIQKPAELAQTDPIDPVDDTTEDSIANVDETAAAPVRAGSQAFAPWASPDRTRGVRPSLAAYENPEASRPRLPAFGFWSPEPGTVLACRGFGQRAIFVTVHGVRAHRNSVSGVVCGV